MSSEHDGLYLALPDATLLGARELLPREENQALVMSSSTRRQVLRPQFGMPKGQSQVEFQ